MSSSTIFIKKPSNYRQGVNQVKDKYKEISPFLTFLLWTFSGLYTVAKTGYNPNATGLILSFALQDVIGQSLATIMLYRGLSSKNILLMVPWIILNVYTLYSNHYLSLISTANALKKINKATWLAWTHLSINVILLIIRVTLCVRVLQLCVNLWFKQQFQEAKKKLV